MITLGVGTGEEAAPIQVGRLFDMIALRVDAEGGAYWREERMFTTKASKVGAYSGEGAY